MAERETISKTFWDLINNYTVEIPIIQRDYAQGRDSAIDLRNRFLDSLLGAVKNGKSLKLDFVYGDTSLVKEKKIFRPLDGQQRLTTLWLLHWYVALKAGELNNQKDIFLNLKYMVRESSEDFIKFLCGFDLKCANGKLCDTIRIQNGFYKKWQQDPTVVSMLNMLDSIEEKLPDETDFKTLWTSMTKADCPVFFYLLPLKDIGHTDDLYVKMNARGKALTAYENFKADLVKAIRDNNWGEKFEYSKLLDGKWTDVFWKNRLEGTSQIDEIYLAFITRYLANVFICEGNSARGSRITEDTINEENPDEWKLYLESASKPNEKKAKKYQYTYTSYKPYKFLITKEELDNFKNLFDNYPHVQADSLHAPWNQDVINYIPVYESADTISVLSMKQRLVFHGISCYLRIEGFEEEKFDQWMRIVWNLSENLNTESTLNGLFGALRTINELGKHSHNIYEWLIKDEPLNSDYGRAQVFEEREKARRIIKNNTFEIDKDWEKRIKDEEIKYHGAIRFLFLNAESHVDWDNFNIKRDNLSKMLTSAGITKEYRKDAIIIRKLISYCTLWLNQIQSWSGHYRFIFSYVYDNWRDIILLRVDDSIKDSVKLLYAASLHHILIGDDINQNPKLEDPDPDRLLAFETLINTDIVNYYNGERYYVRWYRNNLCLYPSAEGVMLTMADRDAILSKLIDSGTIIITKGRIHPCIGRTILGGWDVNFLYNGQEFTSYDGDKCIVIRTMDKNGQADYNNVSGSGFQWQKNVQGSQDEKAFLDKLDESINSLKVYLNNNKATDSSAQELNGVSS